MSSGAVKAIRTGSNPGHPAENVKNPCRSGRFSGSERFSRIFARGAWHLGPGLSISRLTEGHRCFGADASVRNSKTWSAKPAGLLETGNRREGLSVARSEP